MTARFSGPALLSSGRFLAFAVPFFGAAAVMPPAVAQGFSWADGYQSETVYRELPEARQVRRQARPSVLPKNANKAEKIASEGKKPQGPLVIAISIQRQQVKVYDANGLFAESPISTGMPGHPTPMGVFSIIQRSKYHRSNIYSGAPMPYMQRITWSGVAMHAGVLPGYPASHGCIRMPMSFAMKMWSWTRMGARVVVTPGEVSPADFAHPTLAALVPPVPVAAVPVPSKIKTADASNSMAMASQKLSDITTGGIAAASEQPSDASTVASDVAAQATTDMADASQAADHGMPPFPAPAAIDLSDIDVPVGDALRPATDVAEAGPTVPAEVSAETVVTAAAAIAPPVAAPVEVSAPLQVEPAKEIVDAAAKDVVKDQAQLPQTTAAFEPAVATPLIKRNVPVALFVSRKDGRIYVRQNFTPVIDMPIEIASAERALGTHVFTARAGKDDDKMLQWSVVSMPAVARQASAAADERNGRRRNTVVPPQPAAGTAEEALARLAVPPDLMARLGDTLPAGSSLVVSDQGIAQGETGAGTDFIVRLR